MGFAAPRVLRHDRRMRTLNAGMTGDDVAAWQNFLVGLGHFWLEVTRVFDPETVTSTKLFQENNNLTRDGVVGPKTLAAAQTAGFEVGPGSALPPPPSWIPMTPAQRALAFGSFAYVPAPVPGNPEAIRITDGWAQKNITVVHIPELVGIKGAPSSCTIPFHTKGAKQLADLWRAWADAGLLPLVQSFDGSWAPRFIRGSRTVLSNHAWGTAFDINAAWNPLGAKPKVRGEKGSVLDLIPLAQEHGFAWGGRFSRTDAMHFELGKLLFVLRAVVAPRRIDREDAVAAVDAPERRDHTVGLRGRGGVAGSGHG